MFLAIGYASISSIDLNIGGTVQAETQSGIFITDVVYVTDSNANVENSTINNIYQTCLNSHIELSKTDSASSITYRVTIYNSYNRDYVFEGISYYTDFYDNLGITLEYINIDKGTTLSSKEEITFNIIFKYKDDVLADSNILNSYLKFEFNGKLKIGDYVNYDPTVIDKEGTMLVEKSKLTYTSSKGTASTGGSGYSGAIQTFTATNTIKWQVLGIDEETEAIELISKEPIYTDAGRNYYLKGGIAYLYVEEELNKICSIYGHGYGADTSLVTTYEVGGPLDLETRTLEGSRS